MEKNQVGKKDILILGGGGHAKVISYTLKKISLYNVVGFLDDDTSKKVHPDVSLLGRLTPAQEPSLCGLAVIGLGHLGKTDFRAKLISDYEAKGYAFETVIAPSALVSEDANIGKGVYIADGVIIQPGVTIGDFSIINTGASVDHDCTIGSHVHIAPGVSLSGGVEVGDRVLVGTGASIIQYLTVADDCIVGAGAVVVKSCEEKGGVYVGNPARVVKNKFNS